MRLVTFITLVETFELSWRKRREKKSKKYKACEIKIMEAQRFQLLSDEDLERLYDKSHNKNTVRGTNTWVNNLHSMGSFQEC